MENIQPELILSLIQWVANLPALGQYAVLIGGIFTVLSTVASFIASKSTTPDKGTWKYLLYKIAIDLPALNVGKAKQTGEIK